MAPPMGYASQFAIGSADPVDQRMRFTTENFQAQRQQLPEDEITGSASADLATVRYGPMSYVGSVTLRPNAVEWSYLLPWILGGTPSGTTYPLADTLMEKYFAFDRVTRAFLYSGGVVGRATLNCDPVNKLSVTLDLFATAENAAYSFPTLSLSSTTKPFVLTDSVIAVNSVAVCTTSIQVVIDNVLTPDDLTNCSVGPTSYIRSGPRDIRVSFLPAFDTDHVSLYPPSDAGWTTTITFTNGAVSLALSFVAVVYDRASPSVADRSKSIKLPLNGKAYKSGSTLELVTTLDSTP